MVEEADSNLRGAVLCAQVSAYGPIPCIWVSTVRGFKSEVYTIVHGQLLADSGKLLLVANPLQNGWTFKTLRGLNKAYEKACQLGKSLPWRWGISHPSSNVAEELFTLVRFDGERWRFRNE